jgi:alkylation response protein AidB-like acyl-CoA dehydrogenase
MGGVNGTYYSRRNLHFLLYEVFDALSLTEQNFFSTHDRATMDAVLDTADDIAGSIMRPAYVESDRTPPVLQNGEVKVHPALAEYYRSFCVAGLMTATFGHHLGGYQLPKMVYAAADFILGNAHNGFEMFTSLAVHAANLIVSFGSKSLVDEYAAKILNGDATATMCLTETGAGSSLSDIVTEAAPQPDGSYKIKGQKIFISAGDHNITENIIHLVLARVKGAPKGVKGISLFIVPKKRVEKGELVSNDVVSLGLYHKMGQRSTPAMHLEFGGNGNCIGHLIGEEGKGLSYMFQMMNGARLGVGLAGTYIASAAYYQSLQYAQDRPQGRRLSNKNAEEPPVTIIHHPDVRRMLFLQKAFVEGSLSLLFQCYQYMDKEKGSSGDEKQRYNDLLELLTPVAKTYGAEMGIVSVNNGLQVLGGYGYTEDFMLEQLARDVRIMSLYEGTTGIQSIALLGRQIPMNSGRAFNCWKEEVLKEIDHAQSFSNLQQYAGRLLHEVQQLETVTKYLLEIAAKENAEVFLSDATLYMELFSLVSIGWQWLKQAAVTQIVLNENNSSGDEANFYRSKMKTAQFFFHYELVKTKGLFTRLTDEKVLTVWKEEEVLM